MGLLDELQAHPELWQRMSSAMPDVTRTTDPQIPPTEEERFAEAVRQLDRQMKSAAFPTAVSTSPQVTGPGQMTQSSGEAVLQGLYDITPAGDVEAGLDAYRDPTAWNLTMAALGVVPGGDLLKKIATLSKAAKPLRRVYQGSPHTIPPEPGYPLGRFKDEFLGSGQGAATFGRGHYQAENIETARDYQRSLSKTATIPGAAEGGSKWIVEGAEFPTGRSGHAALDTGEDIDQLLYWKKTGNDEMADVATRTIERRIENWKGFSHSGSADEDMQELVDFYESHVKNVDLKRIVERPKGHVYESALKAADEDFLVWDKPLSEQSDRVKKALKNIGFDPDKMAKSEAEFQIMIRKKYDVVDYSVAWERMTDAERATANSLQTNWVDPELSGEEIYRAIEGKEWNPRTGVRIPSPPLTKKPTGGASKTLEDEGIRGIKYFDAGSRGPFSGDPALVKAANSFKADGQTVEQAIDGMEQAYKGQPLSDVRAAVGARDKTAVGTSNYVVFNDKDLEILRILGITGMVGTGAAVAAGANGQLPTN